MLSVPAVCWAQHWRRHQWETLPSAQASLDLSTVPQKLSESLLQFKSQPYDFPVVSLGRSCNLSCLSFFICEMGLLVELTSQSYTVRITWVVCKVLSMALKQEVRGICSHCLNYDRGSRWKPWPGESLNVRKGGVWDRGGSPNESHFVLDDEADGKHSRIVWDERMARLTWEILILKSQGMFR